MDIKLTKRLCRVAPNLFSSGDLFLNELYFCGFECDNGWYSIIKRAAERLEPLVIIAKREDSTGWKYGYYHASQVKEKYGTLRFYLSSATDEMYAIAAEAEKQSAKTCEQCGKPGRLRGRDWLYTACEQHTRQGD